MRNWKGPRVDGIQGYWIKNIGITCTNNGISQQFGKCVQSNTRLSDTRWDSIVLEKHRNINGANSYRPRFHLCGNY